MRSAKSSCSYIIMYSASQRMQPHNLIVLKQEFAAYQKKVVLLVED